MNINRELICIVCPIGCRLTVTGSLDDLKVEGHTCAKGVGYARNEIINPVRMVCTTARIAGGIHKVVPVRTDGPVPDRYKFEVVKAVNGITLASPVKMGDIIIGDIFGTGVNVIAERDM